MAEKNAQPLITGRFIKNLDVACPPLPEQRDIADFLDTKTAQIDTLIAKKQRLIKLLQEHRTALINQVVTKGLNPNAPMRDSGVEWLGEIPEHWDIANLRWLTVSVETGKTPPTINQEYYENPVLDWFAPSDFNNSILLKESSRKISRLAIDDNKAPLYNKGTVLLVGIGATLGKVGILEDKGSSNQQINAITYDNVIFPFYGAYYLNAISEAVVSHANFATLPILNQSQTKDIKHLVPPFHEQKEIVQYIIERLKYIQKSIELQNYQISCYEEYRTALISEAVTGKIDVRTAE